MPKSPNYHYHIQNMKDVQHKNVNMTWYYRRFPRHPVSEEKFEMRGRNTIFIIIISGLIQNFVNMFLKFIVFHVYF